MTGKRILNPDYKFFKEFLKDYYVLTRDGQYLFASTQAGRRPDRAFYMIPDAYKLGKNQRRFDTEIGKKLFDVVLRYLENADAIVQEGVQGEAGYETGLRITTSIENPHNAYMTWMNKLMIFPPKKSVEPSCFNYVIQEPLPGEYVKEIKEFWPEFDENEPFTLYDLTEMSSNKRRVISLRVDYFGGAYKKPNLTMVWNKGEAEGLISYHAGCTSDRILKGLSGTGKTTLTVGPELEQDDALLGKPVIKSDKIVKMQLIGLEAASFAKSQGLEENSPEWPGLMKSTDGKTIVLALNIDCENVDFVMKNIKGYDVKVPVADGEAGGLTCMEYDKSSTTNGRFIFEFSELNPDWGSRKLKFLKTESLSFKRFDVLEPMFRVVDPVMATALDSACESIITSAIARQTVGTRIRSYAATDFMAREQSEQALLKWKMYEDLGLGLEGKLVFFINNAGYVGKSDLEGNDLAQGEKVKVQDSKKLIDLVEHRKIKNWIEHPVYGYLLPEPKELEELHGMKDFGKWFNPLNYYTAEEFLEFTKRDIKERTEFLEGLFKGQEEYEKLKPVIRVWEDCKIPSAGDIKEFYEKNYRAKPF